MLTSVERSKTSLYMASRDKSLSIKDKESTLSRHQLNRKISEFRQKIVQSASLAETLQSVGKASSFGQRNNFGMLSIGGNRSFQSYMYPSKGYSTVPQDLFIDLSHLDSLPSDSLKVQK